jgi:hypothetical protein
MLLFQEIFMRSKMILLLLWLSLGTGIATAMASPDSLRHDSIRVEIAPIAESFSDYDEPGFVITVHNSLDTDILVGCDYANAKLRYVSIDDERAYISWDPEIRWCVPYGATLVKKHSSNEISYVDLQAGERAARRWGCFFNSGTYSVTLLLLVNIDGDSLLYEASCEVNFRKHTEDEFQLLHELTECRNQYQCDRFVDDVEKIVGERRILPGRIVQMIVSCVASIHNTSIEKRYFRKALAFMKKLKFEPGYEHFMGSIEERRKSFGRYDLDEE